MKKKDIQSFLKSHKKFDFKMDNMEYIVYPKFIIDAMLKDFKE